MEIDHYAAIIRCDGYKSPVNSNHQLRDLKFATRDDAQAWLDANDTCPMHNAPITQAKIYGLGVARSVNLGGIL